MMITRESIFTQHTHTLNIDVTQDQLNDWQSGTLIQTAMPDLSAADREFLMTGITPEEWAETFGDGL